MLRIFVDQDFDHDILRGLRLRLPKLDGLTALEAGLDRKSDPQILMWAAEQNRVVLTHDRNTMPAYAYERVRRGAAWVAGSADSGGSPESLSWPHDLSKQRSAYDALLESRNDRAVRLRE